MTVLTKWKIMHIILASGDMDKDSVKENKSGMMDPSMKVIGKMIWLMEEED